MSFIVELPALGESVVEGTVSKWLVKEGAIEQQVVRDGFDDRIDGYDSR